MSTIICFGLIFSCNQIQLDPIITSRFLLQNLFHSRRGSESPFAKLSLKLKYCATERFSIAAQPRDGKIAIAVKPRDGNFPQSRDSFRFCSIELLQYAKKVKYSTKVSNISKYFQIFRASPIRQEGQIFN